MFIVYSFINIEVEFKKRALTTNQKNNLLIKMLIKLFYAL